MSRRFDYLSIKDGKLVLELKNGAKFEIRAMEQLSDLCEDSFIMCSSSIDFPHEYSDDPVVLAICKELRSEAD